MYELMMENLTDLMDLVHDLGLEDAVAEAVTLCWDAGIRCDIDAVYEMIADWGAEEEDSGRWAEERGMALMMKEAC